MIIDAKTGKEIEESRGHHGLLTWTWLSTFLEQHGAIAPNEQILSFRPSTSGLFFRYGAKP